MACRRSGVRIPLAPPLRSSRFSEGLVHVWAWVILASGSDVLRRTRPTRFAGVWLPGGLVPGMRLLRGVDGGGRGAGGVPALWRGGREHGEGLAAAAAGSRGQAFGCVPGVVFLPGLPCGKDPLVADDEQGDGEQREGCQSHEAAPAAGDVVGGGVFRGGEAAFGAGAAGVGAAV